MRNIIWMDPPAPRTGNHEPRPQRMYTGTKAGERRHHIDAMLANPGRWMLYATDINAQTGTCAWLRSLGFEVAKRNQTTSTAFGIKICDVYARWVPQASSSG